MKSLFSSLIVMFISVPTFSQVIEVEFNEYLHFNSGTLTNPKELCKKENFKSFYDRHGENKYIINLNENTIKRYHFDELRQSEKILTQEQKNGVLFLTCTDEELSTGKNIVSTIIIDKDNKDNELPLFLHFFTSTVTGTINGYVSN